MSKRRFSTLIPPLKQVVAVKAKARLGSGKDQGVALVQLYANITISYGVVYANLAAVHTLGLVEDDAVNDEPSYCTMPLVPGRPPCACRGAKASIVSWCLQSFACRRISISLSSSPYTLVFRIASLITVSSCKLLYLQAHETQTKAIDHRRLKRCR